MVEALHVQLTALVEATKSGDPADRRWCYPSGHRDEMVERMRRRVLQEEPDMPPKAQKVQKVQEAQEALLLDAPAASAETLVDAAA